MSDNPKPPRYASWTAGKLPLPELAEMKRRGDKIVMVTAYDAPSGRLADAAGVDLILVGDSSGMVVHGRESTVPVSLDEIVFMTQWVTRGAKRPLVIADMPFGSYEESDEQAVRERGAAREGGRRRRGQARARRHSVARARAIVGAGIPVMGHVGLTPQTATVLGGFKAQGRTAERAQQLVDDALALEEAGCFAIVLEAVPPTVGARGDAGARRADDRHRRRRGDATGRCSSGTTCSASTRAARRASSSATRSSATRSSRRSDATPRRCAAARSPRSSTRTRCPRRSRPRSRPRRNRPCRDLDGSAARRCVALVTGATRGVGKGVALVLGEVGATVYVSGRRPSTGRGGTECAGRSRHSRTYGSCGRRAGRGTVRADRAGVGQPRHGGRQRLGRLRRPRLAHVRCAALGAASLPLAVDVRVGAAEPAHDRPLRSGADGRGSVPA